ncbi:Uma2 family endonuclease [Tautonia plasticadhaerens]|uniref:Putative restriction endonuclease domain-containing protein n=1 Tax=Tautonia plasticadhaerens TaxID=2527974 RepID=A0A518GV27_9BACT|nr:Uma2 family endonuclease [Tautonia plasticadhaerens]QDV32445.1 hypothetical protein ElP_02770 [Tautonia plasticadhaerens]
MATARRRTSTGPRSRRRHTPYRVGLDLYHRIAELGLLGPRDKVVLLDGILVNKMTKGDPHISTVKLIVVGLGRVVPQEFHVSKEDPIALPGGPWGGDSEPEPDVLVLRGTIRDYNARKPGPADVPLIVEVADSSLYEDRRHITRFAWAGIPVCWLVNLRKRTIEVYTDPSGPGEDPRYATVRTLGEADPIPVVIDGRDCGSIPARDLLP